MRYDTPVYFCKAGERVYNETTGDYADADVTRVKIYADVTDTEAETMTLVYGKIRQGSLTIRLQNHYLDPFDYIEIGGKRYAADAVRKLRTRESLVVSEVQ